MKFSVITSTYNQLEMLKHAKPFWDKQTFGKDFEWIIADDGSSDGTAEWCEENLIPHVFQEDKGYRLTSILNKAGEVARGDYLVWVMADSYPKETFLEELSRVVAPDKMHNGLRLNVDQNGRILSPDWRTEHVLFDGNEDEIEIVSDRPWRMMTLNSMVMPRDAYNQMGGIFPEYDGYGKMDWDLAAYCLYNGMKLYWCPRAIIYHFNHPDRGDTSKSTEIFDKRLEEFKSLKK